MKSFIQLSILVALLVGATVLCAHADSGSTAAGGAELKLLQTILTGFVGKTVGLLVAFVGAYTAVVKGNGVFGVALIFMGVLVAFLPGVYNGVKSVTCPIVEQLAGSGACGHSADWMSQ